MSWYIQYCLPFLDILGSMDTPIISCIISKFQLIELRATLFHPVEQFIESYSFGMIKRQRSIKSQFFLSENDIILDLCDDFGVVQSEFLCNKKCLFKCFDG